MKKYVFTNAILTFLLCFLTHFLYEWFPNPIFSILFPVNESIWEHMKMLYTTILIYGIIEYFILKKFSVTPNNFLLNVFLKSILAIPIYLIIYLPLYNLIGENFILNIIVLFVAIVIVNIIGFKIIDHKEFRYQKIIGVIGIILVYIAMTILTYKTPHLDIFFDSNKEKYGINDYLIKE